MRGKMARGLPPAPREPRLTSHVLRAAALPATPRPRRRARDAGNARPFREEAQGREGDDLHIGALRQEARSPPQDFRCRHQDLQHAIPETRRPLQRNLPRPIPHHRRQGTIPDRCVAEGPRPQVLCVHETGCRRNPPHQIRRVRGGSVIACSSPLPIKNG